MPKKPPATLGIIYRMPLEDLHPHPLNPYGVRDDPAMQELVGSVKENGVLIPAIARPRKEGGYELISGHRRKSTPVSSWGRIPCRSWFST